MYLIPMIHIPEIGAENSYQNWYYKPAQKYSSSSKHCQIGNNTQLCRVRSFALLIVPTQ